MLIVGKKSAHIVLNATTAPTLTIHTIQPIAHPIAKCIHHEGHEECI